MKALPFRLHKHNTHIFREAPPISQFKGITESIINLQKKIGKGVSKVIRRGSRDHPTLQQSDSDSSTNSSHRLPILHGLPVQASPDPVLPSYLQSPVSSNESGVWDELSPLPDPFDDDDISGGGFSAISSGTTNIQRIPSLDQDQSQRETKVVKDNDLGNTGQTSVHGVQTIDCFKEDRLRRVDALFVDEIRETSDGHVLEGVEVLTSASQSRGQIDTHKQSASITEAGAKFTDALPGSLTDPLPHLYSAESNLGNGDNILSPFDQPKVSQSKIQSSKDNYDTQLAVFGLPRPLTGYQTLTHQTPDTRSTGGSKLDQLRHSTRNPSFAWSKPTSASSIFDIEQDSRFPEESGLDPSLIYDPRDELVPLPLPPGYNIDGASTEDHEHYPSTLDLENGEPRGAALDTKQTDADGPNPTEESFTDPQSVEMTSAYAFAMIGIHGKAPRIYPVQNKQKPGTLKSNGIQKSSKGWKLPRKCPFRSDSRSDRRWVCRYRSKNQNEFKKHLKRHIQRCLEGCNFGYANQSELKAHKLSKHNPNPNQYSCNKCSYSSPRPFNLNRHKCSRA